MRILRKIHKWLSIPVGLIISVICITGAILALQDEIIYSCNRDVARIESIGSNVLPIDQLASKVNAGDGIAIASLNIYSDPYAAYRFRLDDKDGSFVYANQYTGEISSPRCQMGFFNVVRRLHRFLLDSRPTDGGIFWGKNIVGVCTILLVAIILTGILVWWPRHGEKWRHKLRVRIHTGFSRFNFDLHCNASVYASVILLIMALTGLTWSFGWYKTAFYWVLGEDAPITEGVHNTQKKEKKEQNIQNLYQAWEKAYEEISATEDFKSISFSAHKADMHISEYGNMRAVDTFRFDENGNITAIKYYNQSSKTDKIKGWVATMHRGSFGGLTINIIWAIVALMGGLMPITGYIIWLKKVKRRHKSHKN